MIATLTPKTKPQVRAIPLPERSKLAAAVRFLGLDYRMIGKHWLDVGAFTLEELVWCVAYAQRYTDEKLPPLPAPRKAMFGGASKPQAPEPVQVEIPWEDESEVLPLPEPEMYD